MGHMKRCECLKPATPSTAATQRIMSEYMRISMTGTGCISMALWQCGIRESDRRWDRDLRDFGLIFAVFRHMRSMFSRSFFAVRLILNVFVGCVLYSIAIPNCYVPEGMGGQHFNWLGLGTPSLFFGLCTFVLWVR